MLFILGWWCFTNPWYLIIRDFTIMRIGYEGYIEKEGLTEFLMWCQSPHVTKITVFE